MAAVAEALAEGGALVLLLLFFVLLALARSIQWWLRPVINSASGIPLIGRYVASWVTDAENAVIGALEAGYKGSERLVSLLWQGLIWQFTELGKLLDHITSSTYNALYHLYHVSAHDIVKSFIAPIHTQIANLQSDVSTLATYTVTEVASIGNEIDTRISNTVTSLEDQGLASFRQIGRDVSEMIDTAKSDILHTLSSDIKSVEGDLATLRGEERAAVYAITSAATGAEQAALQAAGEAATAAQQAAAALAEAAAANIPIAVPTVPPLQVPGVDASSLKALGDSVAGIAATVGALIVDTGLENQDCRSKIKGVCGTNTNAWSNLVAGLALATAMPTLSELAAIGREAVAIISVPLEELR